LRATQAPRQSYRQITGIATEREDEAILMHKKQGPEDPCISIKPGD